MNGDIPVLKEKVLTINRSDYLNKYSSVRNFSVKLCKTLLTEDYVIQSMPDVSPTKWHLAHVSWFFETFVLKKGIKNYESLHPQYNFLFNSYYVQAGKRWTRAIRGLLSRPTVNEVYEYRAYVDEKMMDFITNSADETFFELAPVIDIGINHEQQHQELILTDIKHLLSINPLRPVYAEKEIINSSEIASLKWIYNDGGIKEIGSKGENFSYDNEFNRHKVLLNPFLISSRLITNIEYISFINDNGYERAELWLSDGFAAVQNENWKAPLYWENIDGEWWNFTLNGFKKVNPAEPVCHVSHYEADAFARWAGARLPFETEWETAADNLIIKGNFVEDFNFHPIPLKVETGSNELNQMFGDVWEWTQSAYLPYPGYKILPGALGEYNGKFMSNQIVLRGGSCATSITHIRKTYRNFFPPHSRWQFMGIRLAKDVE
jgi:ergothioneine biosynthesis protein EgtB